MKFRQNVYKNFNHTSNMLLHYLVKCTTCFYFTVNNFHVVPNDQQTILQFIDILNS